VSEWISVKKRLPKDYKEVDVWFDVTASPRSYGMADRWREPNAYRQNGKWVHRFKGEIAELNSDYITHWICIPTPPVE
jgi:hypothetical protein